MRQAGEVVGTDEGAAAAAAWAASGAMALTGWPDAAPLGPPAPLVPAVARLAASLRGHARATGRALAIDPLALLGERAAVEGFGRQGRTSCGGSTRLVPTADGWLAVALARPEDRDLVPAWLGLDAPVAGDPWPAVVAAAAATRADELAAWGAQLGLPVAALPADPSAVGPAVRTIPVHGTSPAPVGPGLEGVVVVDLSSLWAGPLCTSLLGALGATVVKVESTTRPDGARQGPATLFDLLHAGQQSVAVDLGARAGRTALHELIESADVVVEASRPRALRALGVDARAVLAAGPRLWISITGHGRGGDGAHRVAFGDDAAVGGGLVATDARGGPVFCADAVADPLTGLTAAVAAVDALVAGGRWLLDVSMAGVAASMAGPTLPVGPDLVVAAPRVRAPSGRAPALGAHTAEVLAAVRRRGRP